MSQHGTVPVPELKTGEEFKRRANAFPLLGNAAGQETSKLDPTELGGRDLCSPSEVLSRKGFTGSPRVTTRLPGATQPVSGGAPVRASDTLATSRYFSFLESRNTRTPSGPFALSFQRKEPLEKGLLLREPWCSSKRWRHENLLQEISPWRGPCLPDARGAG